jgi:hypothetical protein
VVNIYSTITATYIAPKYSAAVGNARRNIAWLLEMLLCPEDALGTIGGIPPRKANALLAELEGVAPYSVFSSTLSVCPRLIHGGVVHPLAQYRRPRQVVPYFRPSRKSLIVPSLLFPSGDTALFQEETFPISVRSSRLIFPQSELNSGPISDLYKNS